ncbi:hypothetical protein HanRHA438_Chr12g0537121 [Helianthus annuus]|nr:hypothetical protein HanRHA438_Chr12g0537121 [Helianthus annuus]
MFTGPMMVFTGYPLWFQRWYMDHQRPLAMMLIWACLGNLCCSRLLLMSFVLWLF